MSQQKKIDQLHRTKLEALQSSYKDLTDSISEEELVFNKILRREIRKVRRQMKLIGDMSQSFDY